MPGSQDLYWIVDSWKSFHKCLINKLMYKFRQKDDQMDQKTNSENDSSVEDIEQLLDEDEETDRQTERYVRMYFDNILEYVLSEDSYRSDRAVGDIKIRSTDFSDEVTASQTVLGRALKWLSKNVEYINENSSGSYSFDSDEICDENVECFDSSGQVVTDLKEIKKVPSIESERAAVAQIIRDSEDGLTRNAIKEEYKQVYERDVRDTRISNNKYLDLKKKLVPKTCLFLISNLYISLSLSTLFSNGGCVENQLLDLRGLERYR